jgi:hypothetical protein
MTFRALQPNAGLTSSFSSNVAAASLFGFLAYDSHTRGRVSVGAAAGGERSWR